MKLIQTGIGRAMFSVITIFGINSIHAQNGYTVTERGPDYKVMEKTIREHGRPSASTVPTKCIAILFWGTA